MKCCLTVIVSLFCSVLVPPTFAQKAVSLHEEHLAAVFLRPISFDTASVNKEPLTLDTADLWKSWKTVGNYQFGKNRGTLPMIADLDALHPFFRDQVIELFRVCKSMGIELAVVESYRTKAKQAEYYAMGRQYTSTTGGHSRHQYGMAVDVVPIVDSVAVWNDKRLWKKIGIAGEQLGMRWGGRWRVLYDPGHFEWSGGVSRQELANGLLPEIPPSMSDRYPELGADLKRLQRGWNAWEVEQSMSAHKAASTERDVAGLGQ